MYIKGKIFRQVGENFIADNITEEDFPPGTTLQQASMILQQAKSLVTDYGELNKITGWLIIDSDKPYNEPTPTGEPTIC